MVRGTLTTDQKGQASIEYLMNYAWAIALIIIVGVAIFALDIGGLRNRLTAQSSQVTQAGETLAVTGYSCDSGDNLTVAIENRGANLLTGVSVAAIPNDTTNHTLGQGAGTTANLNCDSTELFPQDSTTCINQFEMVCASAAGDPYEIQVNMTYTDDETSITHTPQRNFTGTLESA